MLCDRIWRNARLAPCTAADSGTIPDGLLAARDGRIVYAGRREDAPALDAPEIVDCGGRVVTPGLIDPHTHLVYAGNRAEEFELRLAGASYAEIMQRGGGIVSTMRRTREADQDALVSASLPRLDALIGEGVTTVEIKSGYGLSLADELKQLRAARALGRLRPVRVVTTLLAAHVLPPEFAGGGDAYIEHVCHDILPAAAREGLADQVDGFCERIAFAPAQIARVFSAARSYGLPVKLHAEQLSNSRGATLAAEFGALSADHLEYLDAGGIAAMARAGTVATLLPGAYYFLRETRKPPIDLLRQARVPIALATDCNPGTSPLTSLLLAMNLAAVLFGLTVEECLSGVTRHAARALGLGRESGTLEAGKSCDLAVWNIAQPVELVYGMGFNPLHMRVWGGVCTTPAPG